MKTVRKRGIACPAILIAGIASIAHGSEAPARKQIAPDPRLPTVAAAFERVRNEPSASSILLGNNAVVFVREGDFSGQWTFSAGIPRTSPTRYIRVNWGTDAEWSSDFTFVCEDTTSICEGLLQAALDAPVHAPPPAPAAPPGPPAPPLGGYALPAATMPEGRVSFEPWTNPVCVDCSPPPYPEQQLREEITGTVMIRVTFDKLGTVTDAAVVRSSGDAGLDKAASDRAWKWSIKPGRRYGRDVAGQAEVPVVFMFE